MKKNETVENSQIQKNSENSENSENRIMVKNLAKSASKFQNEQKFEKNKLKFSYYIYSNIEVQ